MATTSAEFCDRVANRHSKHAVADPQTYELKLKATQALMRPDKTMLEFGCGTGSTALLHAPHVAHIDATDISAALIGIGCKKAGQADAGNSLFFVARKAT